ncbi:hypothetical protein BGZ49_001590 [Haplosporangium sp. Z 27]|nr:hypothetical protein BGZ49_001590 [Haplosporangium sp. Z 27]
MTTTDDLRLQLTLLNQDTRGNKSALKERLKKYLKKNPDCAAILKAAGTSLKGLEEGENDDKDVVKEKLAVIYASAKAKVVQEQADIQDDLAKDTSKTNSLHKNSRYDYYLCFDVEATCEEGYSFEFPNEVIEFPVVLMDGSTFEVETVDSAPTFTGVLELFEDFLRKHNIILEEGVGNQTSKNGSSGSKNKNKKKSNRSNKSNNHSGDPNFHPQVSAAQNDFSYGATFRFVTDGPFDIRDFIGKQCIISQIPRPSYFAQSYLDIRTLFRDFFELIQWQNLEGMLNFLGETFTGRQHSGICDARMVGLIAKRLALGFSIDEGDAIFSEANRKLVSPQWSQTKIQRMKGGCILKANRTTENTYIKMITFKMLDKLESLPTTASSEAATKGSSNIDTQDRGERSAETSVQGISSEFETKEEDASLTSGPKWEKSQKKKVGRHSIDTTTAETALETLSSPTSPLLPESPSNVTELFVMDSKFAALMNDID